MKKKLLNMMETFSKAMVQPLSYISVAGMLLVLGVLLTNDSITGLLPFLKFKPIHLIGTLLYESVMAIINNLGLVFVVGISAALAKKDKHQAALIGLMTYLMFLVGNNTTLKMNELLAEPDAMIGLFGSGQASVLGFQVTDMGVFSGIILGTLVGVIFNKTSDKTFKGYWAMYSGTRFTFAIMVAVSLFFGYSATIFWPVVQSGIGYLTGVIASSGSFGLFLYGMLERLLIPTGLHHLVYAPFQFADLGGTLTLGDTVITGAYPILMTELQMGVPFSDSIYYMATGFTKTFGYIGIVAAFYATAKPENKKETLNTLLPLAITASLSGITEPIDFLFAFAAPVLFLLHSVIAGLSIVVLKALNITAMTTGLINSFLMNMVAGVERTRYPLMYVMAVLQILLYFGLFTFLIKKFNFKTPGREEKVETQAVKVTNTPHNHKGALILEGLGGIENINTLDNCFTRLRIDVLDASLIDEDILKQTDHSGLVTRDNNVQIIYGIEVPQIKEMVEALIGGNK